MVEKIFADAINEAIAEEMRRDPNVFIMGEDIRLSIYGATKNLYKEFGVLGFLKIFWRLGGIKRKTMFRAFKMKKKWPFKMPEEYLSHKISDLREEHGIKILLPEELQYTPIER